MASAALHHTDASSTGVAVGIGVVAPRLPLVPFRGPPRHVAQCLEIVPPLYQTFDEIMPLYRVPLYLEENGIQGRKINHKMRAILVDWLLEVGYKYRFCGSTLSLTVNILDRFLSTVVTDRSKLQLVGVSSLLIAAKYEEWAPPPVAHLQSLTSNACKAQEILLQECLILKQLRYDICVPTGDAYLKRFTFALNFSPMECHLASFYSDRSLQEHSMLEVAPDRIAAAACYLARRTLLVLLHEVTRHRRRLEGIPSSVLDFRRYFPSDMRLLKGVAQREIIRNRQTAEETVARRSKYDVSHFCRLMDIVPDLYTALREEVKWRANAAGHFDPTVPEDFGWDRIAVNTTKYSSDAIVVVAMQLQEISQEGTMTQTRRVLEAVRRQYSQARKGFVAVYPRAPLRASASPVAAAQPAIVSQEEPTKKARRSCSPCSESSQDEENNAANGALLSKGRARFHETAPHSVGSKTLAVGGSSTGVKESAVIKQQHSVAVVDGAW